MNEVYDFLKKCSTYFLATVDGNKPKVRPFGTIDLFEGALYIQSGKKKGVARQIKANPNIEICASKDGEWIRISCEAIEDDRREARKHMLDAYPELRKMYDEDDDNTIVYKLTNCRAGIFSFTADTKVFEF